MAGRRRGGASDGGCHPGGSPCTWDGTWEGKILEAIYGHYNEALDALPLEDMPALVPRLLDAGVSFGFADPVTNIVANTLAVLPEEIGEPTLVEPEASAPKKRKRKRKVMEDVLSKIVASDGPSPPETRTIAERSLEGLSRFLTNYFRHLSTCDALRYLCLARADLLIAVRLIQDDRCYRRSEELRIDSLAVEMALKCAAFSARLPNVDGFLRFCSTVASSRLNLITGILSARQRLTIQDISSLSRLIKKPPIRLKKSDKRKPMDLAAERFCHQEISACIEHVSSDLTESLQSVLMDKIHHHYLNAVSRFPLKEFQTRYHRGLLKSGFCYGPFDPESNILVNAIWYDTVFPPSEGFEADMIYTLRHVESRSLNGLIAFVCACFPEICKREAMIYLLKNKLHVSKVIRIAELDGYASAREDIGYKSAANVASHPNAEEYLEFAVHHLSTVRSSVRSLLHTFHVLSSSEILELSNLLSFPSVKSGEPTFSSVKSGEPTAVLTEDAVKMIKNYKEDFISQQNFVHAKVEAALQNYEQAKGHHYELGIICGVNYNVGKERRILDSKCQYSHANFWASSDDGTRTTLFFAEFSNYEDNSNHQSFCYPTSDMSAQVRCCYCECEGIRIVHPIEPWWKGARGFEEIACGENTFMNEEIISREKLIDNQVMGIFDQDYLYLDPAWDKKLIQDVNRTASMMNLDINAEMRRIKARDCEART